MTCIGAFSRSCVLHAIVLNSGGHIALLAHIVLGQGQEKIETKRKYKTKQENIR